jgi:pimeloyl-ACP methyl ester carboxylesterase
MTTTPRLNHVQCLDNRGLHRMAYWEWGDERNPHVVVCVHGLTRQGRDFDTLARALCGDVRVVCPDVVGRGVSDWLADPMHYGIPQYVADMVTLLARVNAERVDWVGTSMGGLIGLGVAALEASPGRSQDAGTPSGGATPNGGAGGSLLEASPGRSQDADTPSGGATPNGGAGGSLSHSPLRRFIINDVGPTLAPEGLARIGGYVGRVAQWATLDEAADALWQISQGFGVHTPEQWLALTEPQLKRDGDKPVPRSDPQIALPFKAVTPAMAQAGEALLWQAWDRLALPTLLVRGANSDLLSPATARAMTERGPRARLVEFAGVGHAPMFVQPDQVAAVREFILSP